MAQSDVILTTNQF